MQLILHVDGGARGNPGPAGAGVVIRDAQGAPVHEAGYWLGRQTNNAAEYLALIRGLTRALEAGARSVVVHSDSELLVRQITGEYQVRNARLSELYGQAQKLLLRLPRWIVRHIARSDNARADQLANLAMDKRRDIVVFDIDPARAAEAENVELRPAPPDTAAARAAAADSPEKAAPQAEAAAAGPAVWVRVAEQAERDACPAGGVHPQSFAITATLPAGLCVHAAHALLPTILAMLNTSADEFAAVPTMTVRCVRPDCGAVFQLSPAQSRNGVPRT